MKNILLLTILIPLLAISQNKTHEQTLTSFADVEFADGKIIYSIDFTQSAWFHRLTPKMFDKKTFVLRRTSQFTYTGGNDIKESVESIKTYLNTEFVVIRTDGIANDYLRLCVLMIIIDGGLSAHATDQVEQLGRSGNGDIKKNAALVMGLLELYKQNP